MTDYFARAAGRVDPAAVPVPARRVESEPVDPVEPGGTPEPVADGATPGITPGTTGPTAPAEQGVAPGPAASLVAATPAPLAPVPPFPVWSLEPPDAPARQVGESASAWVAPAASEDQGPDDPDPGSEPRTRAEPRPAAPLLPAGADHAPAGRLDPGPQSVQPAPAPDHAEVGATTPDRRDLLAVADAAVLGELRFPEEPITPMPPRATEPGADPAPAPAGPTVVIDRLSVEIVDDGPAPAAPAPRARPRPAGLLQASGRRDSRWGW